jgi:hypothetical protein
MSVDFPRVFMYTIFQDVNYLLHGLVCDAADCRMLIVMTMNVEYFLAVLVGISIGEIAFGKVIYSGHSHAAGSANVEATWGS